MDMTLTDDKKQRTLFRIALGILILIAAYVRWERISLHSFFIDELWHVFSAKSFIDNGIFALPSGWIYNRAYPFTYLVSVSFRLFGVSEMSARLPGVIFGVAVIPAAYVLFSRLVGRPAAIITALVLALSPLDIMLSSFCRMYTLFQLLYIFIAYYFYLLVEGGPESVGEKVSFWRTRFVSLIILSAIFFFTIEIQKLVVLFAASALGYCAVMSVDSLARGKWKGFVKSPYTWIVGTTIAAAVGFLASRGGGMLALPSAPVWSLKRDANYYRWFLQSTYPLFYYLFPVSAFYLILRRPKQGIYLSSCFVLPFFFMSYVIPWRALRYLHFIMPYFIVINAFLCASGISFLWRLALQFNAKYFLFAGRGIRAKTILCLFGLCLVVIAAHAMLLPWIRIAPEKTADIPMYNLNSLLPMLDAIGEEDTLIVTEPHILEHYSSRMPDRILFSSHSEHSDGQGEIGHDASGYPVHGRSGMRFVMDLAELKSLEERSERVWIFTNDYYMKSPPLEQDIVDHMLANYERVEENVAHYDLYVSGQKGSVPDNNE